jgi:Carboxypeptidase regulatory-like domain/TonB-dependent Receptor Plug Domain/TonB dependent receptor
MKSRVVAIALSLFGGVAFAQTSGGVSGLTGIVTDSSGAAIPNAQVVIDNPHLGIHRQLTTTNGGVFNAPSLVPSSGYDVTIKAAGFAAFEDRNVTILVGQDLNISATLQVEQSSTRVEVIESAPIVEVKTEVSQNVTQKQIDNLPINGRRVDSFVLLTPGVVPDGTSGLLSFRGIPGGNNFMTDGNDSTETFYNENAGRTRIPTQISQDAVQEFQVLSDAYSAEYGRALGGVVNTVTRSGTNEYHGTGYWFFRNRTLDARDPFATFNPSEARHQFGGSIGGPIIKNKLFAFFNTEDQIRDFPLVSSIINPSAINSSTLTWNGCGVASGGLPAATPQQCAAINATLPRFFTTLPRTGDQQTGFGKIDWRPNDSNSVSLSFNYQHFNSPDGIQTGAVNTGGGALNSNGIDDVQVRYARVDWTAIVSPNQVNEARFGWFKDRQADSIDPKLLDPTYGAISLSVNGQAIGSGNYLPRIQPSESRFEYADNFSWTIGRHNFKFGVDYFHTEDFTKQLVNGNGSYSFSNANAFALDYSGNTTGRKDYTSFQQAFGTPAVDANINEIAFYAQDQYRITPKLTLYYGLRYERTFLPTPPLVNPDYPQTGRIPDYGLDFAPRVGFAWNLGDKTVIRSGYGIYYARYPGAMINSLFTTNNLYQQSLTLQTTQASQLAVAPVFPNLLPSPAGTPGAATVGFAANNLRTPYSEQGDFAIQRAIDSNTSITVSYLWSRAAELLTVRDFNLPVVPSHSITYNILNASGTPVGTFTTPVYLVSDKIDPRYSRLIGVDNGGNSYYNALAVQLQRRLAHGFQGGLAYTWGHAIDDNMGNAGGNLFLGNNAPSTLFNGDYHGNHGDSSLDQRQRLVINWIYSPTFTHRTDAVSRLLINNWQLANITTIATGQPSNESLSISNTLTAAQITALGLPSNLAFTNTLNGFGGSSQVPFLGINTLRLPNSYKTDARLSKILPFTERFRATLNFEVFNLTNTPTFTGLVNRGYTASGLNIMPSPGLGTLTASSGFPDGTSARRAQASLRFEF